MKKPIIIISQALPVQNCSYVEALESDEDLKKLYVHKEQFADVISAIEKQIPKPLNMSHCNCGMPIDKGWKYCPDCGQKVKIEEDTQNQQLGDDLLSQSMVGDFFLED